MQLMTQPHGQKALMLQVKAAAHKCEEVTRLQERCQNHAAEIFALLHVLDVERVLERVSLLRQSVEELQNVTSAR